VNRIPAPLRHWTALLACLLVVCAVLAPVLATQDPHLGVLSDRLLPPAWLQGGSWSHLFGTDVLGRDIFSRLLYGARVSLLVAFLSVLAAGLVGAAVGIAAGYFGGWLDNLLMRIVDLAVSLPIILIALLVGLLVGPSLGNIVVIIGLVLWSVFARIARNESLRVSRLPYVDLARTAGCSSWRIALDHILPNVAGPLIVLATLQVGTVIMLESALSFLGVGVPPPNPAWGSMIADGRSYVLSAWWICVFPGIAILVGVLTANLLGDRLAEFLDPARRRPPL